MVEPIERQLVDRVRARAVSDLDALTGGLDGRAMRDVIPARRQLAGVLSRESAVIADDRVLAELAGEMRAELVGAGPLAGLLALPGVTDVLVNGPDQIWFDRGRGLERSTVRFSDDGAVRRLAQRLAALAGRRLDDAEPFVDAALADGTRLHAILPPLALATTISLRVLGRQRRDLAELVPAPVAELLTAVVQARLAFLISGGTGVGKTTLLGALLGCVPPEERIVLIEDAQELQVAHPHVVRLLRRLPNVEGSGAVELRELVRQALRMRPDRVVVGEFRGAETAELLMALNTGHEGGAATVHANSVADVPARLLALGGLAGLTRVDVEAQLGSAFHVLVQLRRDAGVRAVSEIALLVGGSSGPTVLPIWSTNANATASAESSNREGRRRAVELFQGRGVAVPSVLR